jgi:hypothetical protein
VQWGPWADVGMAGGRSLARRLSAAGVHALGAQEALRHLLAELPDLPPCVGWARIDWRAAAVPDRSLFAALAPAPTRTAAVRAFDGPAIAGLAPERARHALEPHLLALVGEVLRLDAAACDALAHGFGRRTLADLGFDSLSTVQWRERLARHTGVALPLARLHGGAAVSEVAAALHDCLRVNALVAPDDRGTLQALL